MKNSILLLISNDAPVSFLQILSSISHETTFSKKTKERSQSILYCVSQNRFSVRHPIQSEKYGDAKSYMSTGFVPYFKDNYYE